MSGAADGYIHVEDKINEDGDSEDEYHYDNEDDGNAGDAGDDDDDDDDDVIHYNILNIKNANSCFNSTNNSLDSLSVSTGSALKYPYSSLDSVNVSTGSAFKCFSNVNNPNSSYDSKTSMSSSVGLFRSCQSILAALDQKPSPTSLDSPVSHNFRKIDANKLLLKQSRDDSYPFQSANVPLFSYKLSPSVTLETSSDALNKNVTNQILENDSLNSTFLKVERSLRKFEDKTKLSVDEMQTTKLSVDETQISKLSVDETQATNLSVGETQATKSLNSLVALLASQINESDVSLEQRDWSDTPSLLRVDIPPPRERAMRMGNIYEAAMNDVDGRHQDSRRRKLSQKSRNQKDCMKITLPTEYFEADIERSESHVLSPEHHVCRSRSELESRGKGRGGNVVQQTGEFDQTEKRHPLKENSRKIVSTFIRNTAPVLDLNAGSAQLGRYFRVGICM